MKFRNAIHHFDAILQNGPLGTRLKFEYGIQSINELLAHESGHIILNTIYENDLAIAEANQLPIILNAATYRASKNHLQTDKFTTKIDVEDINTKLVSIVKVIKDKHVLTSQPIFIGAPIGSMGDAYCKKNTLSTHNSIKYHSEQINSFKCLDVDFINAVTIPSLTEATGIALAAENAVIDYTIGFILNKEGRLLDNTNIIEAISYIDAATHIKPLGYLITCTHASTVSKLTPYKDHLTRLIGVQLNGSNLDIDQLAICNSALADTPKQFTSDLIRLKKVLGLKIVGGCCGTTTAHLQCLATMLSNRKTQ